MNVNERMLGVRIKDILWTYILLKDAERKLKKLPITVYHRIIINDIINIYYSKYTFIIMYAYHIFYYNLAK